MSKEERDTIGARIKWLVQKLEMQRDPTNEEYTESPRLVGRTEGNIGALEWVLRELK